MGYSKFHKFVLIWCSNFVFCVLILCFFAYKISITTKLVESVSTRMTLVIHRLAEVGERVIYKSLHKRKPPLSFVYSFKFLDAIARVTVYSIVQLVSKFFLVGC